MPSLRGKSRAGLAPIEVSVLVGSAALLLAVLYSAASPLRQAEREAHCMSNLRQIGRAIQLYRQDYGGAEPSGAMSYSVLGLPSFPPLLVPRYLADARALQCANAHYPAGERIITPYMWRIRPDYVMPDEPFSREVARRGASTPIVVDIHHGTLDRPPRRPPYTILVLRLGGEVQRRLVTTAQSADW